MSSIASLTRREFLAGSAAIVALTRNVHAQAAAGPFKLEPLPYPNNALEPHIDAKTMEIHHGKHHNAYVTNLNAALEGKNLPQQSIEDLCRNIEKVPEDIRTAVRNNGGGHANHSMFWTIMSP